MLCVTLPLFTPGCESDARHQHERFELAMLEQLESPDPIQRVQAAVALADVSMTARGMSALRRALEDPDVRVRLAAAGSLAGTRLAPGLRATVRRTLLGALQDTDPRVRVTALRAMALPPWRDSLTAGLMIPFLLDTAMDVRAAAAQALGALGPDAHSALPALEQASRDSVVYVREEVRNAIRMIRRARTGTSPVRRGARVSPGIARAS